MARKVRCDCLGSNSAGKIEAVILCNAKIENRDTEAPAHESNETAVSHLYVDARARLHPDFERTSCGSRQPR